MAQTIFAPKDFSDAPRFKYLCPKCGEGTLRPKRDTFKTLEPQYSKNEHKSEAWEPEWITYRFTLMCVCDEEGCGEVAFVSGNGSVDQRYDEDELPEYYDRFIIQSFYPSPDLCYIPAKTPSRVASFLKKSFLLYWTDTAAASNALRASLEALLDEMEIPKRKTGSNGKTNYLALNSRLNAWSAIDMNHAELCRALKEVGNVGSHGEAVETKHYLGALEIYSHVLTKLFENNATEMKELAQSIRDELASRRNR